jgi:hypothetical protein
MSMRRATAGWLVLASLCVACGPPPTPLSTLRDHLSVTVDYLPAWETKQLTGIQVQLSGTDGCITVSATTKVNGQALLSLNPGQATSSAHGLIQGCKPASFNSPLTGLSPLTGDLLVSVTDSSDTLELSQPGGFEIFPTLADATPLRAGGPLVMAVPSLLNSNVVSGNLDTASFELTRGDDGLYHGTVPTLSPGTHRLDINEPISFTPSGCVGFARCTVETTVFQSLMVQVQ